MSAATVKKVTPYPIPITVTKGSDTVSGRIAKLTNVGLLAETEKPLSLGQQYSVTFTIPVINRTVQVAVVVIKTYARYGGEPGKTRSHTINELHFRNLSDEYKISIHSFLSSIRQT